MVHFRSETETRVLDGRRSDGRIWNNIIIDKNINRKILSVADVGSLHTHTHAIDTYI